MANNRNTVITTIGNTVRLYLRHGSINTGVLTLASVDDAEAIAAIWELSIPFADNIVSAGIPAFLSGLEVL